MNDDLLRGWNTWNNPSLLSHVRQPDGLNLQFLLRKRQGGPYWLTDAYVANPKYDFAEKLQPLEHAYDGSYSALQLEWEGVHARIESATDGEDLMLLYTPVDSQASVQLLVLKTGFLWNRPGTFSLREGTITATSPGGATTVRAIGTHRETLLPLNTPYFSFASDGQVAIYTGAERSLAEIKTIVARQKAALREQTEAYCELAYANVIAITGAITDGGFVPNVAATYATSNDRSQPPMGAMTVKLIYDRYREKWFLEKVFDELLTWNRWWAAHRDNRGFLSWGSHPHPRGMSAGTLQAARWESGLDNSPMFDEAVFNTETNLMEVASVGLLSLFIAYCKYLSAIAAELGRTEEVSELNRRATQYGDILEELWDEQLGLYRDMDLISGAFTPSQIARPLLPATHGSSLPAACP